MRVFGVKAPYETWARCVRDPSELQEVLGRDEPSLQQIQADLHAVFVGLQRAEAASALSCDLADHIIQNESEVYSTKLKKLAKKVRERNRAPELTPA